MVPADCDAQPPTFGKEANAGIGVRTPPAASIGAAVARRPIVKVQLWLAYAEPSGSCFSARSGMWSALAGSRTAPARSSATAMARQALYGALPNVGGERGRSRLKSEEP